jgi:hypothetical protein
MSGSDAAAESGLSLPLGQKLGKNQGGSSVREPPLRPFYLLFLSLRGLDLNQRPLGYESCVSRSPHAYPLVTGHVRCSQITSDDVRPTRFGHKNQSIL